jgi:hypothetical protein
MSEQMLREEVTAELSSYRERIDAVLDILGGHLLAEYAEKNLRVPASLDEVEGLLFQLSHTICYRVNTLEGDANG